MKRGKKIFLWGLAFILTAMVVVYQRKTGPTYPVENEEKIMGCSISYELLRSHEIGSLLPVKIEMDQQDLKGILYHRVFKSGSEWIGVPMIPDGNTLKAGIPELPPAGKVEYRIQVFLGGEGHFLNRGQAVVARFKGKVPDWVWILHVIFMVVSLMLAFRTGFEVFQKEPKLDRLVLMTLLSIFIGGFILGPLMQKFAFGHLWTGFPFGYDLTDNKTLLAFVFWLVAYFLRTKSKWWVLGAVILMLFVYLIPHSVLGSELDPKSGKMKNVYGSVKKTTQNKINYLMSG